MKKGIVFDLDGTLVDSIPGIAEGLNLALTSIGRGTHSEQDIRSMVGQGAKELCRAALGLPQGTQIHQDDIQNLLDAFMLEYPLVWLNGTHIFENIREGLISLQEKGIKMGVLSNKPHEVTAPMVKKLFPDISFEPIMGYSPQFPRKPDPGSLLHIAHLWGLSKDEICLVGDSIHDAHTAQNAKVDFVPVGWGYCDRQQMEGLCIPIHDRVRDLFSYLRELVDTH